MHRAETIRHHKHKQISHTITPSYHHTNLTIRQETYNPQCLCVRGIHTLLLDYFFTMRKIPWYFNVCLLLQYKPQSDQEKNANNKLSFLTTGLCLPTVTTVNVIFFFPLCLWLDLTSFSLEFCKNSKPASSGLVVSWVWFYNLLFHQNHNLSFWHVNIEPTSLQY